MKKLLLAGVATVALVGAASAADLGARPVYKAAPVAPPVPVFSWTGCYVGAHVGWGWGREDHTQTHITTLTSDIFTDVFSGRTDTSGALLGGQVGCDYQFAGAWVIGVGGDISAADINGTSVDPSHPNSEDPLPSLTFKTKWIGSVTGRLGWAGFGAFSHSLIYVKGGGAWTGQQNNLSLIHESNFQGITDTTFSGWTVGGGWEWAFAPNWSAFVEGDYYQFQRKSIAHSLFTCSECGDFLSSERDLSVRPAIWTVKLGVNYRFNWGKAPVVARY